MNNDDFLKNKIKNFEDFSNINSEEIFQKIYEDVNELKKMLHMKEEFNKNFKNEKIKKKNIVEDSEDNLIQELEDFNLKNYGYKYKEPELVKKWKDDFIESFPIKTEESLAKDELNFKEEERKNNIKLVDKKEDSESETFLDMGLETLNLTRKLNDKERIFFKKIEAFTKGLENSYGVNFLAKVAEWIKQEEELYSNK
ncbi:hypothetical protein [Spiroplasma endosymbiont of Panorpa germanica]|uniref:hypothetical protein n=1 Tax=Spiroplasma endosymbiont of Panorpa germanica TaxID=3066314 RepID=UPI0030CAA419